VITFKTKVPIPFGADPKKLAAIGLYKAHRAIFLQSEGGDAKNKELIAQLGKAIKFEEKFRAKLKKERAKGVAPFKNMAKTYFSNKRCLLVALFEDNARQPFQDRLSLEQLIALANQYDIPKDLDEPAKMWTKKKSSGTGERIICAFGPVARAAQRMGVKLLRTTYLPQEFQFTHLGSAKKVQLAMSLIKEKGYTHVAEIDIKDFFPSFTEEELIAALPLPTEAVKHIVMANSADWTPCYTYTSHSYIISPPGIPQGSASSAEVAHWCVAQMKIAKVEGVEVINHADNFFIFAKSQPLMEKASKALSSGIAGLPGGEFNGKIEQAGEVAKGFRMLGCWVSVDKKGEIVVNPTETNWNKMKNRVRLQKMRLHSLLTAATLDDDPKLRMQGLQDYLRLESICQGWMQAFKFCGPHMKDVENEHAFDLALICHIYDITQEELQPLKDASTMVTVKWYSGK